MSGMDRRSFFKIVATSGRRRGRRRLRPVRRERAASPTSSRPTTSCPASPPTSPRCAASARRAAASSPRTATAASSSSRAIPTTRSTRARSASAGRPRCRGSTIPIATAARSSGGQARRVGRRRRSSSPTSSARSRRASRARRIALVSGLETGSLGRLMDEWVQALGARPRIAYEPLGYEALRAANRVDLRPRRHPALRDRGRRLPALLRRRLPRDVAQPAWATPRDFAQMHALRPRASRHVRARRAAHVHDGGQRRRVAAQRARHRRACSPSPCSRSSSTRGCRRPAADAARCAPRSSGVDLAGGRDRPRASPPRRSSTSPTTSPRPRPALALGGGMAATGPQRHRDARRGQPAQRGDRRRRQDRALRRRFGASARRARTRTWWRSTQAMAAGEIEVLVLADVNPGLRACRPSRASRRRSAKVPLVVSLASRPNETTARAAPGAADAAPARVVGRLRGRGRRDRAHAADDGARADRRQAGGRQGDRRHPAVASAARRSGLEEGKGPLKWASFEDYVKERVAEARAGLRQRQAVHGFLGGRPSGAAASGAPRPAAGGRASGRRPARVAGRRAEARGRRLARAHRLSLAPLLRRPRRRPAVAAGSAGHDDPGRVGRLGRDPRRDREQARASRAAISSS